MSLLGQGQTVALQERTSLSWLLMSIEKTRKGCLERVHNVLEVVKVNVKLTVNGYVFLCCPVPVLIVAECRRAWVDLGEFF